MNDGFISSWYTVDIDENNVWFQKYNNKKSYIRTLQVV